MTPRAAHHPAQFISVRSGAWHVGAPQTRDMPPRFYARVVAPEPITKHDPPRHHFNEPSRNSPDLVRPSVLQPMAFDKLSKHDPEHGIIKYNNKLLMDRDVNAEAFGGDDPHVRRPTRANLGYSAVKRKGWR